MKPLDEIKARLAARTPGDTWCRGPITPDSSGTFVRSIDGSFVAECRGKRAEADAHFIAYAPTDIQRLAKALEYALTVLPIELQHGRPKTAKEDFKEYMEDVRAILTGGTE